MENDFLPKCKRLTQDEIVERLEIWRNDKAGDNGGIEARNEVILSISPMAWSMALRLTRYKVDKAKDSCNEGLALVCERLHEYNPSKGAFTTWAYNWIFNGITNLHRKVNIIRTPVGFDNKNLPDPRSTISINTSDREGRKYNFPDRRSIEPGDEAALNEDQEYRNSLLERSLSKLPLRTRAIIERRSRGEMLKEIGKDFGISKERVRQIERDGFRFLRKYVQDFTMKG